MGGEGRTQGVAAGARALDLLAAVCLVGLLAIPLLALVSGSGGSTARQATVALPPLRRSPAGPGLRDVPAFTSDGAAQRAVANGQVLVDPAAMDRALDAQARAALTQDAARALLAKVKDPGWQTDLVVRGDEATVPAVDDFLTSVLPAGPMSRARAAMLNDLAGLLILARSQFGQRAYPADLLYPRAAPIAFGLLQRAAGSGSCDPLLNLGFLLTADPGSHNPAPVVLRRAAAACGADPTPVWLAGQYESARGDQAITPFRTLQRRAPGSPLGWAGEGDALIRSATVDKVARPFTARAGFRRALALYRRAADLDQTHDPAIQAGEAAALAGLGRASDAVTVQGRVVRARPRVPEFQDALVAYLEQAHRYGEAADQARTSSLVTPALPRGDALIARRLVQDPPTLAAMHALLGPVSIGIGTVRPIVLSVGLPTLPLTDGVTDISFIPIHRSVSGVTGDRLGCGVDAYRRDLVLAGHAADARQPVPASITDREQEVSRWAQASGDVGAVVCSDNPLITAVARFAAGEPAARAAAGLTPDPDSHLSHVGYLYDLTQNLFRYGGNPARAAQIARDWSRVERTERLGPDRVGEIAYGQRDYARAARWFHLAGDRSGGELRAGEQLKEGTAREMAGDLTGARRLLEAADAAARRGIWIPHGNADGTARLDLQALLDSYNARVQLGDTWLREHRWGLAERHYRDARVQEQELRRVIQAPPGDSSRLIGLRDEPIFRPEALQNNEAIALLKLGRPGAISRERAAVISDPGNPVFRANLGQMESEAGRRAAAEQSYRAALASDPTHVPAANNLGVLLAQDGDLSAAIHQFRHAIAVSDGYATAHFNLALALDRLGPGHVLEAQGQFARAGRLDHGLRQQQHQFITDDQTFFTDLDLSKPVPPNWQFISSERRTPVAVGGVVLILMILRLIWAYEKDDVVGSEVEGVLDAATERFADRVGNAGLRVPGAIAVGVLVGILLYPTATSAGTTGADLVVVGVGITVLTLAFMRVRTLVARRAAVVVRHYPHIPAIVVGIGAAMLGVGFAPVPASAGEDEIPARARWVSVGLIGCVSVALLLLGRATYVPYATQFGLVGLAMTGSALLPIEPFDGAHLAGERLGVAIGVGLALLGLAVQQGVL